LISQSKVSRNVRYIYCCMRLKPEGQPNSDIFLLDFSKENCDSAATSGNI